MRASESQPKNARKIAEDLPTLIYRIEHLSRSLDEAKMAADVDRCKLAEVGASGEVVRQAFQSSRRLNQTIADSVNVLSSTRRILRRFAWSDEDRSGRLTEFDRFVELIQAVDYRKSGEEKPGPYYDLQTAHIVLNECEDLLGAAASKLSRGQP